MLCLNRSKTYLLCGFLLSISSLSWASDEEGRRVLALVIGNSKYQGISSLINAGNDAQLIGSTLSEIGVDSSITRYDLTRAEMSRAVNEFFGAMSRYDVGLVYYAGHGMQDEYGENYLVPVDFGTEASPDLYSEGFPTERIFRGCSRLNSKAFVFFLDACRNNPYPSDYRSSGSGLGEPEVPSEGVLVGFSTESGKVAGDYAEESNGHYAMALSEMLKVPNMKAEDILKEVGTIVRQKSDRKQSPEWWGNLSGSVIFNFDAEQYEVQLGQLQRELINDINSFFLATDIVLEHHSTAATLPQHYFGLGSKFRNFSEEHLSRGQLKLARQAQLYALIVDWHWGSIHGDIFPDSKSSIEFLDQSDKKLLFVENPALVEVFGIESEIDLAVFLAFVSLRLFPDYEKAPALLEDLNDNLWLEDDLTWAVGASCVGFSMGVMNASNGLRFLPESHHFTIQADTISSFVKEAYPDGPDLHLGQSVKSVIIQGDTVSEIPNSIESPVTIILEGEERGLTLLPNPGFVVRDSIFIPTRSREDYLKRYRNASELLIRAEINELQVTNWKRTERPKFHDVLSYQAVYVAQWNWFNTIMNQCSDKHGEVTETLWSNYKNELFLLSKYEEFGQPPLSILWMLLFDRFDYSCNQLLVLEEDFVRKNSREIANELFKGAEFLRDIHVEFEEYSGEFFVDLPQWSKQIKFALGGTIWAVAAGFEGIAAVSKNPQPLVNAATSLSEMVNKRSIDQWTDPYTYLLDCNNYVYFSATREFNSGSNKAILAVTELLYDMAYVFRPYEDETTKLMIDHPIFSSGRFDLLVTNDPRQLTEFFRAFGIWSKIYFPGYYKPLQYALDILNEADYSEWSEIERKEVLVSIGALVENYQAQATQYYANHVEDAATLTGRVDRVSEEIEGLKGEYQIELEWHDNCLRNHNKFLQIIGSGN